MPPVPAPLVAPRRPWLGPLAEFLRIPSVSSQPRHAAAVRRCAHWLAAYLRRLGFPEVCVVESGGHPAVLARWRRRPAAPTVLIYGHYDVQPVEPLPAWRSSPFDPVQRGDCLYARGASDDKGQLFAHLAAIEQLSRRHGELPANVVCVFEGEEEIGSPHLLPLLRRHRELLSADVALISDGRIPGPEQPALTYGLRGALGVVVEVRGAGRDLHSGAFGGAAADPARILCELVAALHRQDGRIAIPGFYDAVRPVSAAERALLARHGPADTVLLGRAGTRAAATEKGYSLYERTTIRPALVVQALTAGYQGPGGKSAIPGVATARLNLRLVPDQDPWQVERLLRAHLQQIAPPSMQVTVQAQRHIRPALLDRTHPAMHLAAQAYRAGFGRPPVLLRSGGSIPVVAMLQRELRTPVVLMGFGLPDDGAHGPNECLHLPTLDRAIHTSRVFLTGMRTAAGEHVASRGSLILSSD